MQIGSDIARREFQGEEFDVLLDDLVAEIEARNYRVTRVYDIDNVYDRLEQGIDVTIGFKRYKIVEFCNLNSCSELISADLLAGVFMPVRFVVYQKLEDTVVHVAFLKPTSFANLFDSEPMMKIAAGLQDDMTDVLKEVV